eukprot:2745098-Ditylum_brightwellii.AAC.1
MGGYVMREALMLMHLHVSAPRKNVVSHAKWEKEAEMEINCTKNKAAVHGWCSRWMKMFNLR